MIIAQITDMHIGFEVPHNQTTNLLRLQFVLQDIASMKQQPDLMIFTGDLTEHGDIESYHALSGCIRELPYPVFFALGNHDKRAEFRDVFPQTLWADDFLQYTIEDWPLRIIVLDSLKSGKHGGGFCEKRAQWLESKLAEQPERPTLIALHHPPIKTGIDWMTASPDEDWVVRLQTVLEKHDNIVHIISGHIHRTIFNRFAGTSLSVAPSIAFQVNLELAEIDCDTPDDRPMIVESQPGYCLHYWTAKK